MLFTRASPKEMPLNASRQNTADTDDCNTLLNEAQFHLCNHDFSSEIFVINEREHVYHIHLKPNSIHCYAAMMKSSTVEKFWPYKMHPVIAQLPAHYLPISINEGH